MKGGIREKVRQILDDEGVVGVSRIIYYNYVAHLLKILDTIPREQWDKVIEATSAWYEKSQMANPEILNKIAKIIKD
jgi:Tat protein secretion system quality control protein TatD with DNase activity